MIRNVIDGLLNVGDFLGFVIRNFALEFFFKRHNQLNRINESAPKSSTNEDSFLISASLPSCSATIFLTRCSIFSIQSAPSIGSCIATKTRYFTKNDQVFYQLRRNGGQPCPPPFWALSHVHAAVNVDRCPSDIRRRGKAETNRCRDIFERTQAAEWHVGDQRCALLFFQSLGHGSINKAWRNAIDSDVTASQLAGHGA